MEAFFGFQGHRGLKCESQMLDNDAQDVCESEMFGNRSLLNPEWLRGHQTSVLYTESGIEL